MDRGLYVSMTGAKQIMEAQAANNHTIANVNTVGFRADSVAFVSDPIYGPGYPSRVNAVAGDSGVDFSTGVLQSTGNAMDVAINGKGFITVMAPDGTEAYTREGDLQVTADGAVITANGLPVMSEQGLVNVPAATSVTIGSDGTVSVVPLGLTPVAQSQVDRIKLVNPNTADLKKGPDGLFRLKSGGKSPTDETVTLQSGMLEMSNVNAANSLVNMIELQRLYEFQIKSMNSTDQNEQTAERLMMSTS